MSAKLVTTIGVALLSLLSRTVSADPDVAKGVVSGGKIVPVVDGNPTTCIDVSKQNVTMLLVGLKAQRYAGWFSETKQTGVKIDVDISPPTGDSSPDFQFPRALTLTPVGKGDVLTLPIHNFKVMSNYGFADGSGQTYSNVGLSFTFVDATGSNKLASTIDALASFSSSLKLPSNPFQQGVSYFGDFVKKLQDLDTDPNDAQTLAVADADLYDGTGDCSSAQLHEGTYAIIYDFVSQGGLFHHSNPPLGVLKVDSIVIDSDATVGPLAAGLTRYCFFLNGDSLLYAEKGTGSDCAHASGTRQTLNNPNVIIETLANARKVSGSSLVGSNPTKVLVDLSDVKPSNNSSALLGAFGHVSARMAQSQQLVAMRLKQDLAHGASLSDAVENLGGHQLDVRGKHLVAVSPDLQSVLTDLRAVQRCQKAGIPNPEECAPSYDNGASQGK